jgi:hypothetical protein
MPETRRKYDPSSVRERSGSSCDRAADRPLVLTANRHPEDWYPLFPNPVVAESVRDRLINAAHHVNDVGIAPDTVLRWATVHGVEVLGVTRTRVRSRTVGWPTSLWWMPIRGRTSPCSAIRSPTCGW